MKIAFITYEYPPFLMGGAGTYAKNITEELVSLGCKVTVFTPKIHDMNEDKIENLEVIRVPLNKNLPFKALQFWFKLPKILKKCHKNEKFDLVHINGLSALFLRKLLDIPNILTVHHTVKDAILFNDKSLLFRIFDWSGENNFVLPFIEKRAVKSVNNIIAVSAFTKNQVIKYYGIKNGKIKVIYNGMDKKGLKNINSHDLEKFKGSNDLLDRRIILFVGRVDDYRKGLDLLLKSFKQLLNNLEAFLFVIGSGDNKKALELCKKLDILDYVNFKGYVDESTLQLYYKICDVYVCPSRLEGFGLTILEALSNGAPVIASNVGAIPEIIENGRNGLLVNANDPNQLSKSLYYILNNESLRDKINLNNAIYEPRNWIDSAKETQNLYKSLIGENKLE